MGVVVITVIFHTGFLFAEYLFFLILNLFFGSSSTPLSRAWLVALYSILLGLFKLFLCLGHEGWDVVV